MSNLKDGCSGCTEINDPAIEDDDQPTNFWHCSSCGAHLNRYRGMGDVSCVCGAEYNSGGQRLRDDWRSNTAWTDDDVDDLEGYERSQLAKENDD